MTLPPCQRVRHGLPQCSLVAELKAAKAALAELNEARAWQVRFCDRILAAHEVLANRAEAVEMPLLNLTTHLQTSPHDCGPTAFRIVCDYFCIAPPAPASCDLTGLPPDYLEANLRRAGLRVQFGEMTVDDLKHHGEHDRPVICLVNVRGEGHYVCSRGVSRNRVYVVDPMEGKRDFSRSEFEAIWRDVSRLGGVYHQFGIAASR